MTLQEYANSRGITYEATRQAVKRAEPDILNHITKQGRTRILDQEAVILLDKLRTGKRVKVIRQNTPDTDQTIDQLKNEIILLQRQLIEAREQSQQTALLNAESVARLDAMTDTNNRLQSELDTTQNELEQLRTENAKYHKTIFGLYRKDR